MRATQGNQIHEGKFCHYFSPSWQADDVDLNLYLWSALAPECHLLVGFYYRDRKSDSAEVKKKLDEGSCRSLTFAQLLDIQMLLPQIEAAENYCYWESGQAADADGSDRIVRCAILAVRYEQLARFPA